MTEKPSGSATFAWYHCAYLWSLAGSFRDRFVANPKSKELALAAILFAAMSVETFLNELTALAVPAGRRDSLARGLAEALGEVEESRGSVRLKYLTAGLALGKPVNRGAEPYQSFDLLFRVRDEIVHLKADVAELTDEGSRSRTRRLLDQLYSRHLVEDPAAYGSFLQRLATQKLANWAVDAAAGTIVHLRESIPSSPFYLVVHEQTEPIVSGPVRGQSRPIDGEPPP